MKSVIFVPPLIKRLFHWGPILALTVISVISSFTIFCDLQWWPLSSSGGILHMLMFLLWNVLTLYNLLCAASSGPGYVPLQWKPEKEEDIEYLQHCKCCNGYKAPRSHHCRKCNRCVMKMDHHCPWINNCVGHKNHGSFTRFLFFAPIGCIHALVILISSLYRAVNRNHYLYYGTGKEPIITMTVNTFIGSVFSVGLAIGVIIAVGALFIIQMKSILKNETGIETWIIDKAYYRDRDENEPEDFIYPYNLGKWRNFRMVCHWKDDKKLNGIWWPIREGTSQYDMTVEQKKQKKEKEQRSVVCQIKEPASGAIFPITKGLCVCCCPPCSDEPRIKVSPSDKILVTRWKKRWLYGEVLQPDGENDKDYKRIRGWFPRRCAIEPVKKHTNGDTVCSDDAVKKGTNEKKVV